MIERAHRVGARPRPSAADGINRRPRAIVCCLREWEQKEEILRAARRIKPSGIFVNETLEKRKEQFDKLEEAKRAGKTAYFVLDRLIVKDRRRVQLSSSVYLHFFIILLVTVTMMCPLRFYRLVI